MLPGQSSLKTLRDAQRARTLGLNAQQRQHLSSSAGARSASATTNSGVGSKRERAQGQGAGQGVWRGVQSAAGKKEMAAEVLEGRGLAREEVRSEPKLELEGGVSEEEHEREGEKQGMGGAVEVALEELMRPARGRHISGDFELIRQVKGVIVLNDEEEGEFGADRELGSSNGGEEDEWELLGLEEDEEGEGAVRKEVKPQAKSWASIVGRS